MKTEELAWVRVEDYPPATRGKIVVWGLLASSAFGGMIWQVYHYLVALRRLGFDVWYVEDSDRMLYDPQTYHPTEDFTANVRLLASFMEQIGFSRRWVFGRPAANGACLGALDRASLQTLYLDADAGINLCGAQELQNVTADIKSLIYLETDPVQLQVGVASGNRATIEKLDAYDHLFTYGENIGAPDCLVPVQRYTWQPTRPPVCLDLWSTASPGKGASLTSVANWKHKGKDVVWKGEAWRWSKHCEFMKFIQLPSKARLPMELAVGAISEAEKQQLETCGWRTRPSGTLDDPRTYRKYIQGSLGEFTVAKEQYLRPRSGWFSDRSVCYLAAGRPVIMQDTAFGKFIPTGEGLFAYNTEDEALTAIDAIARDYEYHSAAALETAREYFEAQRVVGDMLRRVGLL